MKVLLNKLSDLLVECYEDLSRPSYKNSRPKLCCKNDFPENFKNSQENTNPGVSFLIKFQTENLQPY